jgi:hypothetical protein
MSEPSRRPMHGLVIAAVVGLCLEAAILATAFCVLFLASADTIGLRAEIQSTLVAELNIVDPILLLKAVTATAALVAVGCAFLTWHGIQRAYWPIVAAK